MRKRGSHPMQDGVSLIELIVFIVVLGLLAATLSTVAQRSSLASAQLLRSQQQRLLAQSLLAEVQHLPFTYCDPNDPAVSSANGAPPNAGCSSAASVEASGPEPGESRYTGAGAQRFDNVNDYQGFAMPGGPCAGLCDLSGARLDGAAGVLPTLTGCTAAVSVTPLAMALGGVAAFDAAGRPTILRVAVRVACPDDPAPTVLEAIRLRYAPNQL